MRDADKNEKIGRERFWNRRKREEDNERLWDERCVEDEKKHIEYLSANNVYSTRIESLVLSTFPFASLSNALSYVITYNEFYVFPKHWQLDS